jgi:hypothetical protein
LPVQQAHGQAAQSPQREQLLQVWNLVRTRATGKFDAPIKAPMPASQAPNFFTLDTAAPFVGQQPFSV